MLNSDELLKTLRQEEIIMILALRHKFKFGEVIIQMRDGVPQRISKVEVFVDVKERNPDIIQSQLVD